MVMRINRKKYYLSLFFLPYAVLGQGLIGSNIHTIHLFQPDTSPDYTQVGTISFPPDAGGIKKQKAKTVLLELGCEPVEYGDFTEGALSYAVTVVNGQYSVIKTKSATSQVNALDWLPPDPGASGDLTVAGIDVDNDCVRDDIENYIYQRLSGASNIAKRKYLFEYAKWLQVFINGNNSLASAFEIKDNAIRAGRCARIEIGASADGLLEDIFIETHETYGRAVTYFQELSQLAGYHTRDLGNNSCVF